MVFLFFHFYKAKLNTETNPYTGVFLLNMVSTENTMFLPVHGDQYKLMAKYENGSVTHYELYDLINDLGETRDLSKQYPSIGNKLLIEIEKWRQSVMESVQKVGCFM